MKKQFYFFSVILVSVFGFYLLSCNSSSDEKNDTKDTAATKSMSKDEMIKLGDYIVTTGACNDCHSPKIMTQMGPVPDSSKLLSGHPANEPLPPFHAGVTSPTGWIHMSPDVTTFIGPWGISYAANLTPDSATGIGAWSEETFIKTLRTGKHLGDANGRDILPPMPWPDFGKKTDQDLKAIYAYLKSLPAVSNRVPAPVAPPDVEKMATK